MASISLTVLAIRLSTLLALLTVTQRDVLAALVHPSVVPLDEQQESSFTARRRAQPLPFRNTTVLITANLASTNADDVRQYLPPVCSAAKTTLVEDESSSCFTSTLNNTLTHTSDFCVICGSEPTSNFTVEDIASQIQSAANSLPTNSAIFLWIKNWSAVDEPQLPNAIQNKVACAYTTTVAQNTENNTVAKTNVVCSAYGEAIAELWQAKLSSMQTPNFAVDDSSPVPPLSNLLPAVCKSDPTTQFVGDWCSVHIIFATSSAAEQQHDFCIKCIYPPSQSDGEAEIRSDIVGAVEWIELNYARELDTSSSYIVATNFIGPHLFDPASAVRMMRQLGLPFARSLTQSILAFENRTIAVILYPYGIDAPQTIYYNAGSTRSEDEQKVSLIPAVCELPPVHSEKDLCEVHKANNTTYCIMCDNLKLFANNSQKSLNFADENAEAYFNTFVSNPLKWVIDDSSNFTAASSSPNYSISVAIVMKPLQWPESMLSVAVPSLNNLLQSYANIDRDVHKVPIAMDTYYFYINASVEIYKEEVRFDLPGWPTSVNVTLIDDAWEPTDEVEFLITMGTEDSGYNKTVTGNEVAEDDHQILISSTAETTSINQNSTT